HTRFSRDWSSDVCSSDLSLGGLLQHSATLLAIAALLIPYGWWLPFALLGSTLPALWVVVLHQRRHHDWWEETTQQRRWAEYFDRTEEHRVGIEGCTWRTP